MRASAGETRPLTTSLPFQRLRISSTCFQASWSRCADIAHQVLRHHRRAALGVHVLEMRHAVIHQGARPGAEQPVRMGDRVPGHARRDRERHLKAVADVVLAVGRHRHVGGDDEGVVAGRRHAIDQRLDALRHAGEIGLIPARLDLRGAHILQRDQRRGAEDHRHVLRPSPPASARCRRDRRTAPKSPSAECRTARHRSCRTASWSGRGRRRR